MTGTALVRFLIIIVWEKWQLWYERKSEIETESEVFSQETPMFQLPSMILACIIQVASLIDLFSVSCPKFYLLI